MFVFRKKVRLLQSNPNPPSILEPLSLSQLLLLLLLLGRGAADGRAWHGEDLVAERLDEKRVAGVAGVGQQ